MASIRVVMILTLASTLSLAASVAAQSLGGQRFITRFRVLEDVSGILAPDVPQGLSFASARDNPIRRYASTAGCSPRDVQCHGPDLVPGLP